MQSILDIISLLKNYGIYIYTRDRIGDLYLMEDEIKELYKANVLDIKDFQMALLILRQEERKIKEAKSNQL
ncbi:cytoplasmic protein [Solibacillus sp. R5-41]|uniref:YqgQ family protein n=1 Tax=Solibacillus sp. R5-41 TaxID=2048654 RepID=UPI000C124629|nr:YqgQ family protein [Solibacillus sp. R5-41]ATP41060.1 cytoplasmic protein [Solibacillus sp. R5-41]